MFGKTRYRFAHRACARRNRLARRAGAHQHPSGDARARQFAVDERAPLDGHGVGESDRASASG